MNTHMYLGSLTPVKKPRGGGKRSRMRKSKEQQATNIYYRATTIA